MDRMTFTVPAEVRRRAQARRDVNWSAVVAQAIEEKLAALEFADELARRLRHLPLGERTLRRIERDLRRSPVERVEMAAALSDDLRKR